MPRILLVEPYMGGSHRQFLQGLQRYVEASYTLVSLPARKWKLRMQLAAPYVAAEVENLSEEQRFFDLVLASTFVDFSVLKNLLMKLSGWNREARFFLYFHENQFAYPFLHKGESLFQFFSINFNSALTADFLAFNSEYNRTSFLSGCKQMLSKVKEFKLPDLTEQLRGKSVVLHPGIELGDVTPSSLPADKPVIVWNHRWEADKNPEEFVDALSSLQARGIKFRLIILGQSFREIPSCFANVEERFACELIHCGYVKSRSEYLFLLQKGTVIVSTALHEFFGIAVIEAVRAGCIPLLPDRLSYTELYPPEYLYKERELVEHLEKHCLNPKKLTPEQAMTLTDRFDWKFLAPAYRSWLSL